MTTLAELIPVLLLKTEQGKLDWEQLGGSAFTTRLNNALLEVGRRTDGIVFLNLRNEANVVVETTNYNMLSSPVDARLNALFDAARRRAFGTDKLLVSLKSQLDNL